MSLSSSSRVGPSLLIIVDLITPRTSFLDTLLEGECGLKWTPLAPHHHHDEESLSNKGTLLGIIAVDYALLGGFITWLGGHL